MLVRSGQRQFSLARLKSEHLKGSSLFSPESNKFLTPLDQYSSPTYTRKVKEKEEDRVGRDDRNRQWKDGSDGQYTVSPTLPLI